MSIRRPHTSRGGARTRLALSPTGHALTPEDLPSPDTKRWVIRRKAEVVAGVRDGLITLEEACQRYSLSEEEFFSWQEIFDKHGMTGLRCTRLKKLRRDAEETGKTIAGIQFG